MLETAENFNVMWPKKKHYFRLLNIYSLPVYLNFVILITYFVFSPYSHNKLQYFTSHYYGNGLQMIRVRCEETMKSLFHGRIRHKVTHLRHTMTRIRCIRTSWFHCGQSQGWKGESLKYQRCGY